MNASFCQTVNKTKEQVQGRGHAYIWDVEQDDPACIESERIVMETERTCVSEECVQTGSDTRLLTTYKSPLFDLDGSVMGTVGVAIDVTQEKAYEKEIIKKNQTLETIFTTIDCGVMRHSADGKKILSANRAALEILGYDSLWEMAADGFDMVAATVVDEDKPKLCQAIQGLKRVGGHRERGVPGPPQGRGTSLCYGQCKAFRGNGDLVYQRFLLDSTTQKLEEKQRERYHAQLIQALSMEYNLVCFFDLSTGKGRTLQDNDLKGQAFGDAFKGELELKRAPQST